MRWAVVLLFAGCGRIAFDRTSDAGISDAPGDSALVNCPRGELCAETSPTTQNLWGVWARSVDDVYAVGDGGVILRRTGGVWRQIATSPDWVVRVWAAPDSDLAIAVGENSRIVRLAGDNVVESTSGGPFLNGVWGTAANRAFIAGEASNVQRWDGTQWNVVGGATGTLSSVWGSGSEIWVGSYGQNMMRSIAGGAFMLMDPPPSSGDWFDGFSISETDTIAIGYTVQRFTQGAWSELLTDGTFASVFEAVHGSDGRVWFIGGTDIGVWTGSGTIARAFRTTIAGDLRDVNGIDGVVWFVGDGGTIYVHQPL